MPHYKNLIQSGPVRPKSQGEVSNNKNSPNLLSVSGLRFLPSLPNPPAFLHQVPVSHHALSLPRIKPRCTKTAAAWLRPEQHWIQWMEGILRECRELRGRFRYLSVGLRKARQSQAIHHTDWGVVFLGCCISHIHSEEMLWAPGSRLWISISRVYLVYS